eukprot:CAMPEP_0179368154 /NCGR_PEP_ID=MMETSP0797-20121207/83956_1 /TAXON_ID=47934 /ORGANISM="Dinophysis acuminata, Strain DAEP01" /LENGTH=297 /DNA_ID=CAMNT_0021083751 /DNA_START=26 /DNA_END=919 /DNA_ORIENTATION=+
MTSLLKAVTGDAAREHEQKMKELELAHARELKQMEIDSHVKLAHEDAKKAESEQQMARESHERQRQHSINKENHEMMQRPRSGIMQMAQAALKHQVDTSILQELEVQGFGHHFKATAFKCKKHEVEKMCQTALANLPPETAQAAATNASTASEIMDSQKDFVFAGGTRGQYNHFVIRRQDAVDGSDESAVALLVYGMSFDCGKVVEGFEETEEEVPIFEDIAVQHLQESHKEAAWFGTGASINKYTSRTERRVKEYKTKKTKTPVFKQTVMNAAKVQKVFDALEYRASQDAVQTLVV